MRDEWNYSEKLFVKYFNASKNKHYFCIYFKSIRWIGLCYDCLVSKFFNILNKKHDLNTDLGCLMVIIKEKVSGSYICLMEPGVW
jgi:hypothetical protein